MYRNVIFFLALAAGIAVGCEKQVPDIRPANPKEEAPVLTQNINRFIREVMNDVYLWYNEVPDIDIRYEYDPWSYFDKLVYSEDKWSYITDDVEELLNSFEGKETSFGWSLAFGQFSNTKTIFAFVEFVYPGTPADEAGFKRGDIIFEMNGSDILTDNYTDLLFAESLTVTYGVYTEQGITNVKDTSLTARQLELNPVLISKIIEKEGKKIGYLFYAQFIDNFNENLDAVIAEFKSKGVTDVILDLRYNPGGTTVAAQHLTSSLAPVADVNSRQVLVTFQWNDKYQQFWNSINDEDQLMIRFVNTVPHKLGLNSLHVLTGSGTASASELCITGLNPYMELTTVGDTTFGKYTASITLTPERWYNDKSASYYEDYKNWGVQPIILRYANSRGVTDFKDGFSPDIEVFDDLAAGIPLGDENEPLLSAAIADITGTGIIAGKSAQVQRPWVIFDRGFSKFDRNKRELLLNNHESVNSVRIPFPAL